MQKVILKVLINPTKFKRSGLYDDPNWYMETTPQQLLIEKVIIGLAEKFPQIPAELDKEDYINTLRKKHKISEVVN